MERKQVLLVTNAISNAEMMEVKKALVRAPYSNLHIKLSLVHVIPRLPTSYFNIPSMMLLVERYYEEAKDYLTRVGEGLDIKKQDQWLLAGKIKTEVLRLAKKTDSHFILASSQYLPELQEAGFKKEHNHTILSSMAPLTSLKRL